MMGNNERNFPDWEEIYRDETVESMPWFYSELDPDLEKTLSALKIESGTFLDLGTGPGTQAIALAQRGFEVTAIDVSYSAVAKARLRSEKQNVKIDFVQDDVLESELKEQFDFILDRGCFHVFLPEQRNRYVETLSRLTKSRGYLFLKCASHLEAREDGPYRFKPEEIERHFGSDFYICNTENAEYQGTLDKSLKALFCTLQRK